MPYAYKRPLLVYDYMYSLFLIMIFFVYREFYWKIMDARGFHT